MHVPLQLDREWRTIHKWRCYSCSTSTAISVLRGVFYDVNAWTLRAINVYFLQWLHERRHFEAFLEMFAEVADCLVPLGLWPEFEDVVNRGIVLSTASRHDLVLNMNILVIIYKMHEYLPKSYTDAIPEHFGDRLLRKFTELSSYRPLKSCPSSTTVSSSTSIV